MNCGSSERRRERNLTHAFRYGFWFAAIGNELDRHLEGASIGFESARSLAEHLKEYRLADNGFPLLKYGDDFPYSEIGEASARLHQRAIGTFEEMAAELDAVRLSLEGTENLSRRNVEALRELCQVMFNPCHSAASRITRGSNYDVEGLVA